MKKFYLTMTLALGFLIIPAFNASVSNAQPTIDQTTTQNIENTIEDDEDSAYTQEELDEINKLEQYWINKQVEENSQERQEEKQRDTIVKLAMSKIGSPYVYGSNGPNSFDCSGFTSFVYRNSLGINIPRVAADQCYNSQRLNKAQLKKGDLVFFAGSGSSSYINHAGIYIGDGKFVHASSGRARGVTISSLDSAHYSARFRYGGRYLK